MTGVALEQDGGVGTEELEEGGGIDGLDGWK